MDSQLPSLPAALAAKLSADLPQPKWTAWAAKSGTPWQVYFPKKGMTPGKRRFFADPGEAVDEILKWSKDRKPDAILGKRRVDDVLWAESMLPPGVSIREAVAFYLEHNASSSKLTLKDVADTLVADLMRQKCSRAYLNNIEHGVKLILREIGGDTRFNLISKGVVARFIRTAPEYWDRFNRKRIASLVCSKAIELDAIKPTASPMLGFRLDKEVKKSVHTLSNEDAQIILDYFFSRYPQYAPAVALQLFAGIRTEELCRETTDRKRPLAWTDIAWGEKIRVAPEVSKTGEARVIRFWSPALTNWLTPFRKVAGPVLVCPQGIEPSKFDFASIKSDILEELNAARKAAKLKPVDFRKNDFRHTFASNTCGFFQDYGTAQLSLGHTNPKTIKRYYTDISKEDAEVFFNSKPTLLLDNVISISA